MPTIEGPKVSLTWENFLLAAAVVLALLAVVVLIAKGADAWKKLFPTRERVRILEEKVAHIEVRLEAGNRRFKAQSADMGQVLQTLSALQMHFISGNDKEKLQESNKELTAYMNQRATRDAEEV
jgi:ABC-type phosphate/phosphonate transport system substrate-binding protein